MSFLKRLFGLGGRAGDQEGSGQGSVAARAEHKGFTIEAAPFKQSGQFQTAGVIRKEVDGVVREHRFIRADRFAGLDEAAQVALSKGRQIVDEQGDRVFDNERG